MFDCVPSEVDKVYWKYTRGDLATKLRLFLSERQAQAVQNFQNLALVASQIFGGKKDKVDMEAETPKTADQMATAFASVFGK